MVRLLLISLCTLCVYIKHLEQPAAAQALEYSGAIDKYFYKKIKHHSNSIKIIKISSAGGEDKYALKVANLISQKGIDIEVVDFCLSACATFLLPAAKTVFTEENDIIGIHHTSFSLSRLNGVDWSKVFEQHQIFRNAENTERLYSMIGGNIYILEQAMLMVQPKCIEYGSFLNRTRLFTEYDYWVPDRNALNEMGVDFSISSRLATDKLFLDIVGPVTFNERTFVFGSFNKKQRGISECL